jgi:hypothetical protein
LRFGWDYLEAAAKMANKLSIIRKAPMDPSNLRNSIFGLGYVSGLWVLDLYHELPWYSGSDTGEPYSCRVATLVVTVSSRTSDVVAVEQRRSQGYGACIR